MTPYASFFYFGITLFFALPLVFAALVKGRPLLNAKPWIVAATALMLITQYWDPSRRLPQEHVQELWVLFGYAGAQWVFAWAYLWSRRRKKAWTPFLLALTAALIPLVCVKLPLSTHSAIVRYTAFAGISYVTFRTVDVIIGIRDGLITTLPPLRFWAYLLFFPTISSGPIDRYLRFQKDFDRSRTRAEFFADLDAAVEHLFRGLAYKFLVASLLETYWVGPASHGKNLLSIVSYMYAYSFYLFFDFAGYSAFAVAFSRLLGVASPENFNLPFLSKNIREFWDRWHISLSWWFRDHVYMRFVLAATKGHWFASRYLASHIGFLLTMGFMGVWHGLQLHYIVYGLYHATLLIAQDIFSRWNKQRHFFEGKLATAAAIFVTFQAVCFGLLIFSGRLF